MPGMDALAPERTETKSGFLKDLRLCVLVNGLAVIVIVCARLGGNCETVRDRKTNIGHLSQVRTLTAKEITHVGTAFVE